MVILFMHVSGHSEILANLAATSVELPFGGTYMLSNHLGPVIEVYLTNNAEGAMDGVQNRLEQTASEPDLHVNYESVSRGGPGLIRLLISLSNSSSVAPGLLSRKSMSSSRMRKEIG